MICGTSKQISKLWMGEGVQLLQTDLSVFTYYAERKRFFLNTTEMTYFFLLYSHAVTTKMLKMRPKKITKLTKAWSLRLVSKLCSCSIFLLMSACSSICLSMLYTSLCSLATFLSATRALAASGAAMCDMLLLRNLTTSWLVGMACVSSIIKEDNWLSVIWENMQHFCSHFYSVGFNWCLIFD